jgi:hypothetical protein
MKKFVQGKSENTAIEKYVEKHLSGLESAVSDDKEVARIRNIFTFLKMKELFIREGFLSTNLVIAEPNYYSLSLAERGRFLQTPIESLCKTMVMENTAYNPEYAGPYYPQYVCCVVQYCATLNSDKLMKAYRDYQHSHCPEKKVPRSAINLRVCEESKSDGMSGYGHNGVTPFFFATP